MPDLTVAGELKALEGRTQWLAIIQQHGLLPALLRELAIDRAIATIDLPDEAKPALRQQFIQQQRLQSEEQLVALLRSRGLQPEELDVLALRPARWQAFLEQQFGTKVESLFLERKDQLDRIVYSLIRVKEAGVSEELYQRLIDGEARFGDLAAQFSLGPEAQTQGILGPVPLTQPHPQIGKLLLISQPGQLWPPRPIGEWWVIVRLEQFLPAEFDDQARVLLLQEQGDRWLEEQIQQQMTELLTTSDPTGPQS